MSRSLKRSVWALMAAPSRAEQFSAISSNLSNTSNTHVAGVHLVHIPVPAGVSIPRETARTV